MQDWASAAMVRVMQAGAARLGLPTPIKVQAQPNAHVPLQDKQVLIGHILQTGGRTALLQLGQGVHHIKDEPLMQLLVKPGQPWLVLKTWLRLEQYLHSRHRILQIQISDCEVLHKHVGKKQGASPSVVESWLVMGVLTALLERSGCQQVEATTDVGNTLLRSGRVVASEEQLIEWSHLPNCQAWRLKWLAPDQQQLGAALKCLTTQTLQEQVVGWIQDRDGLQVDLGEIAESLNMSSRTLQRKLNLEGTRFVDVIGQFRTQQAAEMLASSSASLAEIGFASGYADQAHFCRDSKRRTGLSPRSFRDTSG